MAENNGNVYTNLERKFHDANLLRKMRVGRYDAGNELEYSANSLETNEVGKISLKIEKFIGGGFAGQVYKVKLLKSELKSAHLKIGNFYAIKILIPPSGFSKIFRDAIYWIGFQGPFQLQVNPVASRAGALWQKFIRRAAKIRFGNADYVVDIYATFIDKTLGSCGEISEWIEGRTWRLEVDENMDQLKRWQQNKETDKKRLGSTEYREKKTFMKNFVKLLHDVGGHEFARQYEWSTCKSQPNCLLRENSHLVAVDFRAGLALLPFLPMSPGDFKLIFMGIFRGSLVQFDRGNLRTLKTFINKYPAKFSDMVSQFAELEKMEEIYRNSVLDITHNFFRLPFSRKLWRIMLTNSITGWKIKNLITPNFADKIKRKYFIIFFLFLFSLLPLIGKYFIKLLGNSNWRKHYLKLIFDWKYLKKTIRATSAEKAIIWYRDERISEEKAYKISSSNFTFFVHLILSLLPIGLHNFFTDKAYFKEKLWFIFVRPIRLYFDANLREKWLLEMVEEGKKKHILTDEDAKVIESQLDEPYIQKYLKSLAVHVCTLPITQIVSVLIAIIYVLTHPEMPRTQSWSIGVGIIALFQVIPISPGSLARGLYVLYLVIKERDFKNYNIAVFLGFFKYIGYLAFPIQMTYKYPAMARFMAGHWATEAVHIVPVFGERGALLEHWVFGIFYNWPLTIRRQMTERAKICTQQKPRNWHIPIIVIFFTAIFGSIDFFCLNKFGHLPHIKNIWLFGIILPALLGSTITLFAGGHKFAKRIVLAVISGIITAFFYSIISWKFGFIDEIFAETVWRMFIFAVFSVIGALFTEVKLGDPKYNKI